MIRREHRSHPHALKFGFIEALMEVKGSYNNRHMAEVFGNHEKDAARVIRHYREINPNSTETRAKKVWPSDTYQRKVLKQTTDAEHYLVLLYNLHGVEGI